jgi:hypothetical protein
MRKAIIYLLFNRNGQSILIILAALIIAGYLQKDIPEFR